MQISVFSSLIDSFYLPMTLFTVVTERLDTLAVTVNSRFLLYSYLIVNFVFVQHKGGCKAAVQCDTSPSQSSLPPYTTHSSDRPL